MSGPAILCKILRASPGTLRTALMRLAFSTLCMHFHIWGRRSMLPYLAAVMNDKVVRSLPLVQLVQASRMVVLGFYIECCFMVGTPCAAKRDSRGHALRNVQGEASARILHVRLSTAGSTGMGTQVCCCILYRYATESDGPQLSAVCWCWYAVPCWGHAKGEGEAKGHAAMGARDNTHATA